MWGRPFPCLGRSVRVHVGSELNAVRARLLDNRQWGGAEQLGGFGQADASLGEHVEHVRHRADVQELSQGCRAVDLLLRGPEVGHGPVVEQLGPGATVGRRC